MNLDELLERYEIDARARGYSLRTIAHVKRCVGFFADFLGGVPDVSRVSGNDLRRYFSSLRDKPVRHGSAHEKERKLSPTSINTYARAVKSFWAWLKEEGIIKKNPLASIKTPKKSKTVPTVYTEAELKAVLNAISTLLRERAIVELFLDSGIRLEELSSLQIPNVDLVNCRLKVFGKGGKERFAYFSQITADSLSSYLKEIRPPPQEGDYLFLTKDGHRLSSKRIQDILEDVGRKAGIAPRLAAHKLRRNYATLALKYGSNLEYVKITLGHSDVETTSQAYINVADDDIAAAYRKFSPMINLMQADSKESPGIEARTKASKEILETETDLELRPASAEPQFMQTPQGKYFTLDIRTNEILIESIQVYTTDPGISFRFLLFPARPPESIMEWGNEDLIRADMAKQRVYTYYFEKPLYYRNYEESHKVHAGLRIGQRPLRFDLIDEKQKKAYYEAPVSYKIRLRYRAK